jgi:hypothetical protein
MNPDWEEAIEGCLGYLATEKSHAVNTPAHQPDRPRIVRRVDGKESSALGAGR